MLTPITIARSGFIASGQVGWPHVASGVARSGDIGDAAVLSGSIGSGQVSQFHLGSGAVTSGRIGTTGTPNGTLFLRDDFSWAAAGGGLSSGVVGSGYLASGAVQGFFGSTRDIASGTVGVFDLGSGAVVAGTVGSGAVVSGSIASGQIGHFHLSTNAVQSGQIGSGGVTGRAAGGAFDIASGSIGSLDIGSGAIVSGLIASGQLATYHFASGATITQAQFVAPLVSGTAWTVLTQEIISGVRAVSLSQSGTLQVAMASLAARMPAVGAVVENVASGIVANVRLFGTFQFTSGLADYSGYLGVPVYVGRSGHLVTASGSFNSGGFLSGDIQQSVGYAFSSGGLLLEVESPNVSGGVPILLSGEVGSGTIASGAVQGFFGTTRNLASGTVGVFDLGSGGIVAGTVGSGAIVSGNVASGQIGHFHLAANTVQSGQTASGAILGQAGGGSFNIGSGTITTNDLGSGAIVSGLVASGQLGAFHHASGFLTSGFWVGSGALWGRAGVNQFMIASGTIAGFDIASGGVQSGHIASGQVGQFAVSSGAVTSGRLGVTGSPTGTNFLRDDFTWSSPGAASVSSGAVTAITYASGAGPEFLEPLRSGLTVPFTVITEETVSGIRAVTLSQSGNLRVAMASVAARMPAVGVVFDNVASGIQANVYLAGCFQVSSGLADYSGYLGAPLYVGRSGQLVTASGAFNSGGFASGDVQQSLGYPVNSGGILLEVESPNVSGGVPNLLSGQVGSGFLASGSVQGFFGTTRNIASGTVGVFDFGSGAVVAGTVGSGAVVSGNVASGQLGAFHHASGYLGSGFWVQSGSIWGRAGVNQFMIASGTIATFDIASGGVVSGNIASGQIGHFHIAANAITSGQVGSGAIMGQAGGGPFNIASGTVGTFDIGSGAIQSGRVASGQLGAFHLASGAIGSGWWIQSGALTGRAGPNQFMIASGTIATFDIASGGVISGNIASGQVGHFHLAANTVQSGQIASGAVTGQAGGGNFGIASGTITTNDIGSGAIVSGLIGSGQVGNFAISSGAVTSGRLGVTGTPNGSQFLRDDFSWQSVSVGSGAVTNISFASGAADRYVAPFISGLTTPVQAITEETVSGVRAVALSQSGNLRVAMASVSGRWPAVGVCVDNVASGIQANVYTVGIFQLASGLADFSGYLGQPIYLGRSGHVVSASGSFNSGGLLSGDVTQPLGFVVNSGAINTSVAAALPFVLNPLTSGQLASGNIATYANNVVEEALTAGEAISGLKAVCILSGGVVALAQAGSGLRLPAVGVVFNNYANAAANVSIVLLGKVISTSGLDATWSGRVGRSVFVGSGGMVVTSGTLASGANWQRLGIALSGGLLVNPDMIAFSGPTSTVA